MAGDHQDNDSRIMSILDERCVSICKGKKCFAADDDHRACITDMLINKVGRSRYSSRVP
ncbi:MAG: hypothetical protein M1510_02545 [Nitrospirae bacterium]|nr:hypothetical protein [Nitrospirota bacterium]